MIWKGYGKPYPFFIFCARLRTNHHAHGIAATDEHLGVYFMLSSLEGAAACGMYPHIPFQYVCYRTPHHIIVLPRPVHTYCVTHGNATMVTHTILWLAMLLRHKSQLPITQPTCRNPLAPGKGLPLSPPSGSVCQHRFPQHITLRPHHFHATDILHP